MSSCARDIIGNEMLKYLNLTAVMLALLAGGCATNAERQAQSMGNTALQMKERMHQCLEPITSDPNYEDVLKHTSLTGDFTFEQLSDNSIPTPKQAKLISEIHTKLLECRKEAIAYLGKLSPQVQQRFDAAYSKGDEISLALYQRKISWGEAARLKKTLIDDAKSGFRTDITAVINQLNAQHNAEIQERKDTAAKVAVGAAVVGGAALAVAATAGSSRSGSVSNDVQNLENENYRLKQQKNDAEYECRRVSRTPNRC